MLSLLLWIAGEAINSLLISEKRKKKAKNTCDQSEHTYDWINTQNSFYETDILHTKPNSPIPLLAGQGPLSFLYSPNIFSKYFKLSIILVTETVVINKMYMTCAFMLLKALWER